MTDPIHMVLAEGRAGLDNAVATFGGQTFTATSRNGATMKLARMLVEAGAPDEPVAVYGTEGNLRFTAPSLHGLAAWTIEESDRGIRQRRWKPSPMGAERGQHGGDGDDRSAMSRDRNAA